MFSIYDVSGVRLVPGVLGLAAGVGIIGSAIAAGGSAVAEQDGVRCAIEIKQRAGDVSLEGVVFSKTAIDGSYQLVVTTSGGGGSSNINQGGEFRAQPGSNTSLGTVMLGGDGGSYTAKLKVNWNGHSTECREKVRGSL